MGYTGFWKRFLTIIIDGIILQIMMYLLILVFYGGYQNIFAGSGKLWN